LGELGGTYRRLEKAMMMTIRLNTPARIQGFPLLALSTILLVYSTFAGAQTPANSQVPKVEQPSARTQESVAAAPPMASVQRAVDEKPVPAFGNNVVPADLDLYLERSMKEGNIGKFVHLDPHAPVDLWDVVQTNPDTIYSTTAVFDLEAGPVTITLPDPGEQHPMSMQVMSEAHSTPEVAHAPGSYTYAMDEIGARYVLVVVGTQANP
jgi:hypothetical protein